jgi:hypothetical protein
MARKDEALTGASQEPPPTSRLRSASPPVTVVHPFPELALRLALLDPKPALPRCPILLPEPVAGPDIVSVSRMMPDKLAIQHQFTGVEVCHKDPICLHPVPSPTRRGSGCVDDTGPYSRRADINAHTDRLSRGRRGGKDEQHAYPECAL